MLWFRFVLQYPVIRHTEIHKIVTDTSILNPILNQKQEQTISDIGIFSPKYGIKNNSPCDIWQFDLNLSEFVPWNQKSFTLRPVCVVWESCWWCDDLSASWPQVWRHSASSQPHRQPDGPSGGRRTRLFYGGCGSLILIAAYMLWLTATSPHVTAN